MKYNQSKMTKADTTNTTTIVEMAEARLHI